MLKSTIRAAPRRVISCGNLATPSRRFLSTAPPTQKSRSWKSSAIRWGIAAGGVYYYNTSNVFAEEPEGAIQRLDGSLHHIQESSQPTIDAIVEEKRHRQAKQVAEEKKLEQVAAGALAENDSPLGEDADGDTAMDGLEEEAGQQGAFNPETGEINWDCPCLGGMAHGPCGEEFKAAFSCFVYSEEEPKGMECIDKFKGMQDCFRLHPEMYGSELEDDEEELENELRAQEAEKSSATAESSQGTVEGSQGTVEGSQGTVEGSQGTVEGSQRKDGDDKEFTSQSVDDELKKEPVSEPQQPDPKRTEPAPAPHTSAVDANSKPTPQEGVNASDEGGELVPKAAFDATSK